MTTLMRDTWNFTGSIVSDDGAITHLSYAPGPGTVHGHGYTPDQPHAAAAGIGVDVGLICHFVAVDLSVWNDRCVPYTRVWIIPRWGLPHA